MIQSRTRGTKNQSIATDDEEAFQEIWCDLTFFALDAVSSPLLVDLSVVIYPLAFHRYTSLKVKDALFNCQVDTNLRFLKRLVFNNYLMIINSVASSGWTRWNGGDRAEKIQLATFCFIEGWLLIQGKERKQNLGIELVFFYGAAGGHIQAHLSPAKWHNARTQDQYRISLRLLSKLLSCAWHL